MLSKPAITDAEVTFPRGPRASQRFALFYQAGFKVVAFKAGCTALPLEVLLKPLKV